MTAVGRMWSLDPDIDPAAEARQLPVAAHRGIDRRNLAVRRGRRRGRGEGRGRALVAAGEGFAAQRELQGTVVGGQPGGLQGALEGRRVAAQQVEGVGAVDDEVRGGAAVAVDVEPHLDAAEVRRVEPDLEMLLA